MPTWVSCAMGADREGAAYMTKRKAKAPQYELDTGSVYKALDYADTIEMLIKAQLVSKIAEILERKDRKNTAS